MGAAYISEKDTQLPWFGSLILEVHKMFFLLGNVTPKIWFTRELNQSVTCHLSKLVNPNLT